MPFFIFMCKRARLTKIRRNFVKTSSLFMRKTSSLDKDNEDVCKIRNTFRQRRSLPYPRGRERKEGVSLTAGRGICQTSPCILRSWSLERLRGGTGEMCVRRNTQTLPSPLDYVIHTLHIRRFFKENYSKLCTLEGSQKIIICN